MDGEAGQGQWESAPNSQEYGASDENSRPHVGLVEVAPRFSGRGPAAPARGWAFSSVGESARLITVRSLVRIQKGPRSEPARLLRHHLGDVAQLGEHLLCKQGVAGWSPATSTGAFECHPIGRNDRDLPHLDNQIASLREKYADSPCRTDVSVLRILTM